jgi:hypothetical protein
MDLDDFEELLLDKPLDEKWELIGGRVIRGMVGARLEHHRIVQNVNFELRTHIRAKGLPVRDLYRDILAQTALPQAGSVSRHHGPLRPDGAGRRFP